MSENTLVSWHHHSGLSSVLFVWIVYRALHAFFSSLGCMVVGISSGCVAADSSTMITGTLIEFYYWRCDNRSHLVSSHHHYLAQNVALYEKQPVPVSSYWGFVCYRFLISILYMIQPIKIR